MTVGRKQQDIKVREGKNSERPYSKGHLNGISDSPVFKENQSPDNDIKKSIYAVEKHEVLNADSAVNQFEVDQSQIESKSEHDRERHLNNTAPKSRSDSQASKSQTPIHNKNAPCELSDTVSDSTRACTTMQHVRDLEVAVAVNNEYHRTQLDIEVQVDNNLVVHVHAPEDGVFDDLSHQDDDMCSPPPPTSSDSNSVATNQSVLQGPVTITITAADQQGKAKQSEVGESVCTTPTNTQLTFECKTCENCDGIDNREEDSLQPLHSKENSIDLPPQMSIPSQQKSDSSERSPSLHSDEKSVDLKLTSSTPEQQQMVTDDWKEGPSQNCLDLRPHCSQQLSATSELKNDPLQCCSDENFIDLLPQAAISSQQQVDIGNWKTCPSQLHSDDNSVNLSPHTVISSQPKQHVVISDRKDSPLKQLPCVETFISDLLPEEDTSQLCSNKNTIDNLSPHIMISSAQQLDTGDQRVDLSQQLLSDEHSVDDLSSVTSVSSQQHSHAIDLDKKLSQDHSDKSSIDPPPCSRVSSQQQPDAGYDQFLTVAPSQPKTQSYPGDQKEYSLKEESDKTNNDRSPLTCTVLSLQQSVRDFTCHPKYHSDKSSDKDLLPCTVVSPRPAQQSFTIKEKKHHKHRKYRHQGCRHQKAKPLKRWGKKKHSKPISHQNSGPPYLQSPESKGPANRNHDNAPVNKGNTKNERQSSCGQHRYQSRQWSSFRANTQQVSSPGGGDDDDNDKNGDKEPYCGGRNFHTQHKNLNLILCLLIVLLILSFCFPRHEVTPQQASYTEFTCAIGPHQIISQDLQSHIQDLSLDDCTTAPCRGGIISRPCGTDGEDSASSSSTFPRGNSTDYLISEEETPRLVGQGEEMACIKKIHPNRKLRERSSHTPPAHPRPQQLDLNPFQEEFLSNACEPKLFTCPSPDTDSQEMPHNYVGSHDPVDTHMIVHSDYAALKLGPNPNVQHFLTDINIHQHQPSPPLYFVTGWLSADSSSTTLDHEEDVEQENDNCPAIFRGPGTAYKKVPSQNEGRTLDSGVGTSSAPNQVPATQTPGVAATKIDTSWRASLDKGKLVYLTPSTEDISCSSCQFVSSVDEQTPRSPNYPQDKLVCVKQLLHQQDCSKEQPADTPLSQPPEPLLESHEWNLLLLEPSMKVFPFPSPDPDECSLDFQNVPRDLYVYVGGNTSYTSQMPTFSVTYILTDDTVGRSQQYPLQYFTTGNFSQRIV